jgi:hypothetical protein
MTPAAHARRAERVGRKLKLKPHNAQAGSADLIKIDHSLFADFNAVIANSAQVGGDVVINFDAANTITLKAATLSTLHADYFLFL